MTSGPIFKPPRRSWKQKLSRSSQRPILSPKAGARLYSKAQGRSFKTRSIGIYLQTFQSRKLPLMPSWVSSGPQSGLDHPPLHLRYRPYPYRTVQMPPCQLNRRPNVPNELPLPHPPLTGRQAMGPRHFHPPLPPNSISNFPLLRVATLKGLQRKRTNGNKPLYLVSCDRFDYSNEERHLLHCSDEKRILNRNAQKYRYENTSERVQGGLDTAKCMRTSANRRTGWDGGLQ